MCPPIAASKSQQITTGYTNLINKYLYVMHNDASEGKVPELMQEKCGLVEDNGGASSDASLKQSQIKVDSDLQSVSLDGIDN